MAVGDLVIDPDTGIMFIIMWDGQREGVSLLGRLDHRPDITTDRAAYTPLVSHEKRQPGSRAHRGPRL